MEFVRGDRVGTFENEVFRESRALVSGPDGRQYRSGKTGRSGRSMPTI